MKCACFLLALCSILFAASEGLENLAKLPGKFTDALQVGTAKVINAIDDVAVKTAEGIGVPKSVVEYVRDGFKGPVQEGTGVLELLNALAEKIGESGSHGDTSTEGPSSANAPSSTKAPAKKKGKKACKKKNWKK